MVDSVSIRQYNTCSPLYFTDLANGLAVSILTSPGVRTYEARGKIVSRTSRRTTFVLLRSCLPSFTNIAKGTLTKVKTKFNIHHCANTEILLTFRVNAMSAFIASYSNVSIRVASSQGNGGATSTRIANREIRKTEIRHSKFLSLDLWV